MWISVGEIGFSGETHGTGLFWALVTEADIAGPSELGILSGGGPLRCTFAKLRVMFFNVVCSVCLRSPERSSPTSSRGVQSSRISHQQCHFPIPLQPGGQYTAPGFVKQALTMEGSE